MQRTHLIVAAALFCLTMTGRASAQGAPCTGVILGRGPNRLREVLRAFCIQPTAEGPLDLNEPVQYSGYNAGDEFVLAYNRLTESGRLEEPLRVIRLDKLRQAWAYAEFSKLETEVLPGFTGPCLGAVGDVQKAGALLYVGISLSPSAGCVAVLSSDLELQTVLSGWIVAKYANGEVILEGSTRHFAPTHPLRLSLFNPTDRSIKGIYPPQSDPIRAHYVLRLRTEIVPSDRCESEACEIDPEHFDDELGVPQNRTSPVIAVNDETASLAFLVQFSPIGFIQFDKVKDSPEWNEQVTFVYRFLDGRMEHREFPASEMQAQFGVTSIDALLKPEFLKRIFGN